MTNGWSRGRRALLLASLATMLVPAAGAAGAAGAPSAWAASWQAVPAPPLASSAILPASMMARAFANQTVVQTVRLTAGGSSLRIRFTNEYGTTDLAIGAARVSLVDAQGRVVAGSARALSFGGHPGASIPAGAPWVSDPVDMVVPDGARLRISLFLPGETGLCTCHPTGGATTIVSPPGDFTERAFQPAATMAARAFLSEVDVRTTRVSGVVSAFGDSITDGYLSTIDADRRWTDRLAERLAAAAGSRHPAVVNAGLSGNRVLADGALAFFGQSAVARFDRDVLAVPGVTTVIVLEGINDIGRGMDPATGAAALIAGYRQLIARAHARGIRIVGGTLLPYEGAAYFRAEGEAIRSAVNRWILSSGAFDATIDFDKAMRDPARPGRLRADLQSGDWLHPNDAGYRVMGDAVSLALLR